MKMLGTRLDDDQKGFVSKLTEHSTPFLLVYYYFFLYKGFWVKLLPDTCILKVKYVMCEKKNQSMVFYMVSITMITWTCNKKRIQATKKKKTIYKMIHAILNMYWLIVSNKKLILQIWNQPLPSELEEDLIFPIN